VSETDAEATAIAVLARWLSQHGAAADAGEDGWQVSAFEDCFLLTPSGGRRSNQLYLVRGQSVVAFSPATMSLDDAYATLPA